MTVLMSPLSGSAAGATIGASEIEYRLFPSTPSAFAQISPWAPGLPRRAGLSPGAQLRVGTRMSQNWAGLASRGSWCGALIEARIERLLLLEPDWDGFGARPTNSRAVAVGFQLLDALEQFVQFSSPQVVPTPNGGIQFEWLTREVDIEIELDAAGRMQLLIADKAAGAEFEGALVDFIPQLLACLPRTV